MNVQCQRNVVNQLNRSVQIKTDPHCPKSLDPVTMIANSNLSCQHRHASPKLAWIWPQDLALIQFPLKHFLHIKIQARIYTTNKPSWCVVCTMCWVPTFFTSLSRPIWTVRKDFMTNSKEVIRYYSGNKQCCQQWQPKCCCCMFYAHFRVEKIGPTGTKTELVTLSSHRRPRPDWLQSIRMSLFVSHAFLSEAGRNGLFSSRISYFVLSAFIYLFSAPECLQVEDQHCVSPRLGRNCVFFLVLWNDFPGSVFRESTLIKHTFLMAHK